MKTDFSEKQQSKIESLDYKGISMNASESELSDDRLYKQRIKESLKQLQDRVSDVIEQSNLNLKTPLSHQDNHTAIIDNKNGKQQLHHDSSEDLSRINDNVSSSCYGVVSDHQIQKNSHDILSSNSITGKSHNIKSVSSQEYHVCQVQSIQKNIGNQKQKNYSKQNYQAGQKNNYKNKDYHNDLQVNSQKVQLNDNVSREQENSNDTITNQQISANQTESLNSQRENQQLKQENNSKYETPAKIMGTQLEVVNNLTIPEEQESDEESLGSHKIKKIKGEFVEEIYENGGKYKGYVYEGKRNGEGTFYYKDGGYYQGNWKENMMNGFGRLYYDTGQLAYDGQWYKDQFHGRGKVFNEEPQQLTEPFNYHNFENIELYWKFYEGDLSHDTKAGHGKIMLSNGEYFTGQFQQDRVHGRGCFHTINGKNIRGVWSKGILVKQI